MMTVSTTSIHSDDLTESITLYRMMTGIDPLRNTQKPTLEIIGVFKAAIEDSSFTKPDNSVAEIYSLKRIFVRVSDFYRLKFIKNNYIKHHDNLMRIASATYNRMTGILCCVCYDVDGV
jgi:hypothetical protein